MKNTLLLEKRNTTYVFFKIITAVFFYFFVVTFLLIIITGHAMRKTSKSKISFSSGKNVALSVFDMRDCINYNTLKTSSFDTMSFDTIMMGTITRVMTLFQIISNITETDTSTLNANGSGLANYNSVLTYATGAGYFISRNKSL
jgi:hypothetical protein